MNSRVPGIFFRIAFVSASLCAGTLWANDDEVLPPGTVTPPAPAASAAPSRKTTRRTGSPAIKDADGSAAPNRFEAETVIKSSYTLDGKPLEVDPD